MIYNVFDHNIIILRVEKYARLQKLSGSASLDIEYFF